MLVARRVKREPDQQTAETSQPEDLAAFRDTAAWVLLGEPGLGKSEAMRMEAEAAGADAKYLGVDAFIVGEPGEHLRGKILFLDGLDEVRGGENILQLIRVQLRKLNNPPFRISCRAADWYGSTDRAILEGAATDSKLTVLFLEPLSDADIVTILRDNHGITDPASFVEQAKQHGVEHLLDNPHTLGLLAQAIRDTRWPATRDQVYRLACEHLAQEPKKKHRDKLRKQPIAQHATLDAAGQLSAVLLLSGKTGIALDTERAHERFPTLEACTPLDMQAAAQAIHSRLFRSAGEERMVPSHRSIAEYLAARWLAQQLDKQSLPLGRVLNLLLGRDGRTVAGLRGLYGWLALHSHIARPRLLDADPLTTIIYGDVKPMPVADKRRLLTNLRKEAERFIGFRWDTRTTHPFGALADPGLISDFSAILQAPERDDASQTQVDCVLDILLHGDPLPALEPTVLSIIKDDSHWPKVRHAALETWLELNTNISAAISLLNNIQNGSVTDHDDQLSGTLLGHLYPKYLGPELLLQYLHKPKTGHFIGRYSLFWTYELAKCAPDEHLPALLDSLINHIAVPSHDGYQPDIGSMADKLLSRGIATYGDLINDERLFAWLGIGADKYGNIRRGEKERQIISDWLGAHPERYKAMLSICFFRCKDHDNPRYCIHTKTSRLHNANVPGDLGLWHLQRAVPETGEAIARIHLAEAADALAYQRGAAGLSLESLMAWGDTHPAQHDWLEQLLTWEIPDWRAEQAVSKAEHQQKRAKSKRENFRWIAPELAGIRNGSAHPGVMNQLAGVWAHRFIDVPGETPIERFNNYCENGDEVLAAAEAGFRRCPERADLPSIAEIIDLSIKSREHYIRLPCLIGMDLRWQDGLTEIEPLPNEVLGPMIAFYLTDGTRNASGWFNYLAQQHAALFSEVLVTYASKALKARHEHVSGIYPLAHDPEYRKVAALAAPRLLELFPIRARSNQLNNLEYLLKVTLDSTPEKLRPLVKHKLALKGMDAAQKVYWHIAAALLDPKKHEPGLGRYIGKSKVRINHLANFLGERANHINQNYELSVQFIGKLIEALTPHAETEWPRGGGVRAVTDAVRRGDQVRALVTHLSAIATPEAEQELNRLLGLPTLRKLKRQMENARHELQLRRRESEFNFFSVGEVVQVLANQAPANVADLSALTLAHLDEIATEINRDNDDGFRAFWNVENKKPISQRDENDCRDALLTRLRPRLAPHEVDVQPEGDYAKDTRADLRLSYKAEFELPIEIKKDDNPKLWTALHRQLIDQYAISPRAHGYGVYLVLWFGGKGMPNPTDGGKRPISAAELQNRLMALLDPVERQRINVCVFDVSWPK